MTLTLSDLFAYAYWLGVSIGACGISIAFALSLLFVMMLDGTTEIDLVLVVATALLCEWWIDYFRDGMAVFRGNGEG